MDNEQSGVETHDGTKGYGRPALTVCVNHTDRVKCSGPPHCCSPFIRCDEVRPTYFSCQHTARGFTVEELHGELTTLVQCLGRRRRHLDALEIIHFHSQEPCPDGSSCDQPSRVACYRTPGMPGCTCVHSLRMPFRAEDEEILLSIAESVFKD